MKYVYSLLVLSVVLLCNSCEDSSQIPAAQASEVKVSKTVSAALEIDFSSYIHPEQFVTFGDSALLEDSIARMRLDRIRTVVMDGGWGENLTQKESMRLGVWQVSADKQVTIYSLLYMLQMYYAECGRLPTNAVALFSELEQIRPEDIGTLNLEQLVAKCAVGIDPITGKFYQDFASEEWTPGGVSITVTDDPSEISENWPHHKVLSDPLDDKSEKVPPSSIWKVKIYGETFGNVIYENTVWVQ